MFNTLTSYLLGGSANATPPGQRQGVPRIRSTSSVASSRNGSPAGGRTNSGFLLVSNPPASAQGIEKEIRREDMPQGATAKSAPNMPLEEDWIYVDVKESAFDLEECSLSELSSQPRSSVPSTPASGWNLTPPACFEGEHRDTGESTLLQAKGILETSNFENLLIEHPSKSVYHRSSNPESDLCGRSSTQSYAISRPDQNAENNDYSTKENSMNNSRRRTCDGRARATRSGHDESPDPDDDHGDVVAPRRQIALAEWFSPSLIAKLERSSHRYDTANQQSAEISKDKSAMGASRKMERSNRAKEVESAGRQSASRSKRLKTYGNSGKSNDRKGQ